MQRCLEATPVPACNLDLRFGHEPFAAVALRQSYARREFRFGQSRLQLCKPRLHLGHRSQGQPERSAIQVFVEFADREQTVEAFGSALHAPISSACRRAMHSGRLTRSPDSCIKKSRSTGLAASA